MKFQNTNRLKLDLGKLSRFSDAQIQSVSSLGNSPRQSQLTRIGSSFMDLNPVSKTPQKMNEYSKISIISKFENQRISRLEMYNDSPRNLIPVKSLEELPKSKEFADQLTKYKLVAYKRGIKRRIKEVKSKKKIPIFMHQGEQMYLKIHCKGKSSPLTVDFNLKQGKVRTYVSDIIEKPGADQAKFKFCQDSFMIKYHDHIFKHNWYYFTIQATQNTYGFVRFKFRERVKALQQHQNNEKIQMDEEEIQLRRMINQRIQLKKIQKQEQMGDKRSNYIYQNVKKCGSLSPKSQLRNAEDINFRRQLIYKQKKQKAIEDLNRNAYLKKLKVENEKAQREKEQQIKQHQAWIRALYLIKAYQVLDKQIFYKRTKILENFKEQNAARLIQRTFKNTQHNAEINLISLIRANTCLKFAHAHNKQNIVKYSNQRLIKCIKLSFRNNLVREKYLKLKENIIIIQRNWREYLQYSNRFTMIILEKAKKQIQILIDEQPVIKGRKRNKRQVTLSKYNFINFQILEQVLRDFQNNRRREVAKTYQELAQSDAIKFSFFAFKQLYREHNNFCVNLDSQEIQNLIDIALQKSLEYQLD